jgi:hypothetical protein
VVGGQRPDRASAAGAPEAPEFGFAGGAPGIATEWMRAGDVTLIVLTNRDPETTGPALEAVRGLLRRMKPSPSRP